ncbi:MAG: beta-lactamase family protein [Firmicutes bacterium]|nr:beta-lactamase family protein [Bacillota bacterium]
MISELNPQVQKQIDAVFEKWDRPDSPGCALVVTKDNEIIYERGYGAAQLEYGIPITPDTIFHVASVSKQFTTMAIAFLVADGLVDLDAPIQQYVPAAPKFTETITVRHLVHHTSGLRDQWALLMLAGWRMDDVITKDHLMKIITRQQELNFAPGEEFLYSNSGYTLLAEIVEKVTGKTLRAFAKERIFKPLGMENTHFHDDHEEIVKNRAYSYAPRQEGGWRKSVLSYANVGATSLFTTVRDLAKWLANFSHGQAGGQDVLAVMENRFTLNSGELIPYGFGLIHEDYKGLQEIGHSGTDAGFRSWCGRFKPRGLGIAVLANAANALPRESARKIADILLAAKIKEEPKETAAFLEPRELAGTYLLQRSGERLFLSEENGALSMRLGELGETEKLRPLSKVNSYEAQPGGEIITFSVGEGQEIQCLYQRQIPARGRKMPAYSLDQDQFAAYAGNYYSPELDDTYHIFLEKGELKVSFRRHPTLRLIPWGPHRFLMEKAIVVDSEIEFEITAEQISGFRLHGRRVRNILFEKQR